MLHPWLITGSHLDWNNAIWAKWGTPKSCFGIKISQYFNYLSTVWYIITWNHATNSEIHFPYSMEFHGSLESPNKRSSSSMRFHGIGRAPFQMTQVFHGIPWNSMEPCCRKMKYHLVPWNFAIVILFNTMLPWISIWYSMEFHRTLESPNKKSPRIPWN